MNRLLRVLAWTARAVIAGLAVAFVAVLLRPELLQPPAPGGPDGWSEAVARGAPAIVSIYTVGQDTLAWPGSPGLGSGVILSREGHVATNWHVIEGTTDIRVRLADGREAVPRLLGADPETELALLQIDLPNLPVIPLGRSAALQPGQVVLAVGNPFGLSQTVTQGIVSALGRGALGVTTFEDFIQTDAAINVGNSGGALLDTRGRLVGVNTAAVGPPSSGALAEGIGFAIPVDLVLEVTGQLLRHGRVIRGWLGVEPVDLVPARAALLGLPPETTGVELIGIAPGSPAETAGLRPGDVLLSLDGHPIGDSREALSRVAARAPGERVRLEVSRRGEQFLVDSRLGERPGSPRPQPGP